MRRLWFVAVAAALVTLIGPPASAGAGSPHVEVDDTVTQGFRLGIKVIECASGEGWTARIDVELRDGHRTVRHRRYATDDDGTTRLRIIISSRAFDPGPYRAHVRCEHRFDNGKLGIFFEESERFVVERR